MSDILLLREFNFLLVVMAYILRIVTDVEQELMLECDCDEAVSSDTESELDEDTVAALGGNSSVN
jgi:hypothetical protein